MTENYLQHMDPDSNYYENTLPSCDALTLDQFNFTLSNAVGNDNSAIIMSLNIRSFHKHKDELTAM